ncbi:hypothetical protein HDV00_000438 [Rhizophlyctis rosea]|nr:hypothetical protein HDV00_000438 [Rhizophlyctis rosea]
MASIPTLPDDVSPLIVQYAHPLAACRLRRTRKSVRSIISTKDLIHGEAKWRLTKRSHENCYDWALRHRHTDIIKYLLPAASRLQIDSLFETAVKHKDLELVQRAIDLGARVNMKRGWAVGHAAAEGNLDLFNVLVRRTAKTNSRNCALEKAIRNGHKEIARLVLQRGVRTVYIHDLLVKAAEEGDMDVVELLG